MYQIDANKIVGRNIYRMRQLIGISQETLSDRINDACGICISSTMIGRYERGERTIDESTLVAIAIGLDTNLQNLQDGIDPRNGTLPESKHPISRLSADDHRIIRYIASDWAGDVHALMIADGCYAALPPEYAARAIMALMMEVSDALNKGAMSANELPTGITYLEQKIGELIADGRRQK